MTDDEAIDAVARRLVALIWAYTTEVNDNPPDAGDFPGLTDDQWTAVCARADELLTDLFTVDEDTFLAAYEHLTGETP